MDETKSPRGLKRPPAIVDSIGQLAIAASVVHGHEVFKALRVCEHWLRQIVARAGGGGTMEDDMPDDLATTLRATDEDTVIEAYESMNCQIAAPPHELLELFNRMLDVLGMPDEDGDVFERVH